MPPWKTTSHIDLLAWLTDIGAAPGSYPAISPSAFRGGAVHGADIAVDEWGTVAAAATTLGFDESGPGEPEFKRHAICLNVNAQTASADDPVRPVYMSR